MDRKEILNALAEWQDQDKENRAILCVAVEREESEGVYHSTQGMAGTKDNLISLIKNALKREKALPLLIRKALQELAFEKAFSEIMGNKESNNETSQEEQK